MAEVVMADDGIAFDGRAAEAGPLGGAETAFVALAEALAAHGHSGESRSQCRECEPPGPRAVFTSNPLRGLDWLLELWAAQIAPAMPEAELHVYAGPAVYGLGGEAARRMEAVLARADALSAKGVRRHPPVRHDALAAGPPPSRILRFPRRPGGGLFAPPAQGPP